MPRHTKTTILANLDTYHQKLYTNLVNLCLGYEYPLYRTSHVLLVMHFALPLIERTLYYN